MCVTLNEINLSFEEKIKKIDETQFGNLENYNSNKEQKSNNKSLSNCWGNIIDILIENGNQHFAITINMPQNSIYLVKDYINECQEYNYCEGVDKIEFSGQEWIPDLGFYPKKINTVISIA